MRTGPQQWEWWRLCCEYSVIVLAPRDFCLYKCFHHKTFVLFLSSLHRSCCCCGCWFFPLAFSVFEFWANDQWSINQFFILVNTIECANSATAYLRYMRVNLCASPVSNHSVVRSTWWLWNEQQIVRPNQIEEDYTVTHTHSGGRVCETRKEIKLNGVSVQTVEQVNTLLQYYIFFLSAPNVVSIIRNYGPRWTIKKKTSPT